MITKARMATDIPTAVTTPGTVETRLGTLRFTDGFGTYQGDLLVFEGTGQ